MPSNSRAFSSGRMQKVRPLELNKLNASYVPSKTSAITPHAFANSAVYLHKRGEAQDSKFKLQNLWREATMRTVSIDHERRFQKGGRLNPAE
jgi:hypothetical protein